MADQADDNNGGYSHSFPRLQETRFSANLDEDACRQVYLSAGGDNETSKEKKGADYADEQLTWQYTRGGCRVRAL
ncbi:hypothetical protein GOP47_0018911 [Adiantum capillus-veneris]|uniref:Uncharacterized protein n=1 Tax=Adiantum capillus-veneris TaxID=13818 RepID=A0A9D4UEL4_ADICA|nr:hypothetical protein GOP47_0018911 [Adiantum capillus-veneris]